MSSFADKIAAAGFLVVVPDFFYDDPVIDLNDPNFDVNSWIKVHNTVSFLLFSCKLLDEHMKNCIRIKKTSRGHVDLPLMFKLTCYHMFMNVLVGSFGTLVEIEWLIICYVWLEPSYPRLF